MAMLMLTCAEMSFAGDPGKRTAPDQVDLQEIKFEIVGVQYVSELSAANAQFKQNKPDEYRGLIVTIEARKPKDRQLKLFTQDFSLHYLYGDDETDVAPCLGISGFSSSKDLDRPMYLSKSGRKSSQTGSATTASEVVYFELFFDGFEPDTKELHLLVAQPCMPPYGTKGWKNS
jgi:hypothetical protein